MRLRDFALRVVFVALASAIPAISLGPAEGFSPSSDDRPSETDDPASKGVDPTRRPLWTTSRIRGTPEPPPPYRVEPAFPRLRFAKPIALTAARGLDRVFVAELGGKIYSFPNRPDVEAPDLTIDLPSAIPGASQLYGIAFHPDFARNRLVYLCYVTRRGGPEGSRVSSFVVEGDSPPRFAPGTEKILLTFPAGGHNAGCLAFGPDGFLYIATGDAADPTPPDPLDTGQDISDLLSSILRIDVDRPEAGRLYRIPPDNPFVGLDGARREIWAFGFRNPWRFSFDRSNGDLWAGDVGWELWEMIHLVRRGGNYGWSIVEGPQSVRPEGRRGPGPIVPPAAVHPHSEAASITGGHVYRGKRLDGLVGVYVYGDFQSGKIWGLRHDGQRVVWRGELANSPLQLVSFGEDNEGEVYALDYERSQQVYKLVPDRGSDASITFPRTLGQTGLFASVKDQAPASGVIPYAINAEFWSDHATAERWMAIPDRGKVVVDESGRWKAPEGSVLARTVSLELERGDPKSRRRLETQILHFEEGSWRPYTYIWDEAQADATLADAEGASRTLRIKDQHAPGGERVQAYRVHARSECALCHNPWVEVKTTVYGRQSASPLAFHTSQLNRETEVEGVSRDQIQSWQGSGLLDGPSPAALRKAPRLANPYNREESLEARARSYLEVNCAHCHQHGAGGSANIVLSSSAPLDRTRALGERPMQGGFGIVDARIIAPGDPEGSVLYYRMAKLGGGRMPRIGSALVDEAGVDLIHDWIESLPRPRGEGPPGRADGDQAALARLLDRARSTPESRAEVIRGLVDSTRGGLDLMRLIGPGDRALAVEVWSVVKDRGKAEVKDLFERFVPESERARRLGERIEPKDILTLQGDARRGSRLFSSATTLCANCHRVGRQGVELGPDLDAIGSKYDRPALLRQILEPSIVIEPTYVNYILETRKGVAHSGMLAGKSDGVVVLRDAKNQTIKVPAADVESLLAQPKSLMPEALLRNLTAQEAADLLEYLGSLKGPDQPARPK
jgi:uncharacterized repeat protein (TIGR03806 family)